MRADRHEKKTLLLSYISFHQPFFTCSHASVYFLPTALFFKKLLGKKMDCGAWLFVGEFLKPNITSKYLMSEVFREENDFIYLAFCTPIQSRACVCLWETQNENAKMLLTLCGKGTRRFFSTIGDHVLFSQGCIPNKWGTSHCAMWDAKTSELKRNRSRKHADPALRRAVAREDEKQD